MKKVQEVVKPLLLIFFGALLLLFYMNYINKDVVAGYLALGIIGVVFAAYYIAAGVLNVVLGNKIGKSLRLVFDILNVCLFAALMFAYFLIATIYAARAEIMGPTAWTIKILSMIAALAIIAFYIMARVVNKPAMNRFGFLFAAIFALALLLDILFDVRGFGVATGEINLVGLVIYALFVDVMFSSFPKAEGQKAEEPVEEKAEEAPAEEPKEE